jgi:hypothetical protein
MLDLESIKERLDKIDLEPDISVEDFMKAHGISRDYAILLANSILDITLMSAEIEALKNHVQELEKELMLDWDPTLWDGLDEILPQDGLRNQETYMGIFNNHKYFLSPKSTEGYMMWYAALEHCEDIDAAIDKHGNKVLSSKEWFLPSLEELKFLYKNRHKLPSEQGFVFNSYWSSNSGEGLLAGIFYFDSRAFEDYKIKHFRSYVRAVRKEPV